MGMSIFTAHPREIEQDLQHKNYRVFGYFFAIRILNKNVDRYPYNMKYCYMLSRIMAAVGLPKVRESCNSSIKLVLMCWA